MKKLLLIACMLVIAVASASADQITITGNPVTGDSWSFSSFTIGSGTLTAQTTGLLVTTAIPGGGPGLNTINTLPGVYTITTGPLLSLAGGIAVFSPVGTITACYNVPGGPYCFNGSITGGQVSLDSFGVGAFTGTFVIGNVDTAILNAIGAPEINGVTGTITASLNGWTTNGQQNRTGATGGIEATLNQTAVPEPASMVLLGTGLLGAGRFVRRKFVA